MTQGWIKSHRETSHKQEPKHLGTQEHGHHGSKDTKGISHGEPSGHKNINAVDHSGKKIDPHEKTHQPNAISIVGASGAVATGGDKAPKSMAQIMYPSCSIA